MIETPRLILRPWRADDVPAHNAICADPRVAATLGRAPSIAESEAVVERQNGILAEHGYCFWAAELRNERRMIGWCGLKPGKPPIEGDTEIGWTVAPAFWGKGLALEAADAAFAWAWAHTGLRRVLAITTPGNVRSWGLMERLGMTHVPDGDFDHPDLAEDDPLRRHITYAIERPV